MTALQFTITPTIRNSLGVALTSTHLPDNLRDTFRGYYTSPTNSSIPDSDQKDDAETQLIANENNGESNENNNTDSNEIISMPFSHIQELSACLKKMNLSKGSGSPAVWIHELIRGSEVIVPCIKKPPPTEDQLKERARLQALYDNMKYDEMTKNVTTTKEQTERMEQAELSDFKSQLGMGGNMIIAAFSAVVFGWFVGKKWLDSDLWGVVLGLFVGIVVLVAETGLFIIKVDRMDTSQSKRAYRFLPATVRARGDTPSTPIPKEALQQIRSHPPLEETQQSITADAVAPQAQSSAKSKNEVKKRKDTKRKQ